MPFVLPTIPFTFGRVFPATGRIVRQSAFTVGGLGRLDAAMIASAPPRGGVFTLTSLGASIGAAPPGATALSVTANATSVTTALAVAMNGSAMSSGEVHIFVEEFSPQGAFIQNFEGGGSGFEFDVRSQGFQLRILQVRAHSVSRTIPVAGGLRYRIWLDAEQFVTTSGSLAQAVCAETYDFGPMFFAFT
jgi:hypothetical protein